jgi:hypothetical protein
MTEHAYGPTGPGTVVLNLGPGIGALVVHTPADLNGREIDITADSLRTHSRVRERPTPAGTRFAAVYPELPPGRYTVWRDRHTSAGAVTVTGGEVARFDWPAPSALHDPG